MSWRQPAYLFGPSPSDRDMMEEVLELLATDSPDSEDRTASTAASSRSSNNNNNSCSITATATTTTNNNNNDNHSSRSGFNHSSINDSSQDDRESVESLEVLQMMGDCDEKKEEGQYLTGRRAVQEQNQAAEAALGVTCLTSIRPQGVQGRAMMSLPQAGRLSPWAPRTIQHDARFFGGSPGTVPAFAVPPVAAQLPVAPPPRSTAQASRNRRRMRAAAAITTSHVLLNGQRFHVMNGAEFDELRRKLRMQTASRRYRKRKKEKSRQQKVKIQELQSELARLQELEMQSRSYQQRSEQSLEGELKYHKEKIAELWGKIQDAAKEEVDWVNLMSSHLRK